MAASHMERAVRYNPGSTEPGCRGEALQGMIFQSRKPLNRQEQAALDNRSTLTFMAEQRKFRWLVATGVLGFAGVAAIGTLIFLNGHGGTPTVATKAFPSVKLASLAPARPAAVRADPHQNRTQAAAPPAVPVAPVAKPSRPPHRGAPAARINVLAKADQLTVVASLPPPVVPVGEAAPVPAPAARIKAKGTRPVTVPDKIVLPPLPVKAVRKPAKPPAFVNKLITVTKGDTLYSLLQRNGVRKQDAQAIINSLKPVYAGKDLYIGQKISLSLARSSWSAPLKPVKLRITPRGSKEEVGIQLTDRGTYRTVGPKRKLARIEPARPGLKKSRTASGKTAVYRRARARIRSSLTRTARSQNIPDNVIQNVTRVMAYDVDFQRDIKRGSLFEVLYAEGGSRDRGVLYSELDTRSGKHVYYRFKTPDGMVGYYTPDGRSTRKAFMRTPINGARITSRFGWRRHPILKYSRMHTGVDFAAPRGTPIYAAADGVVEKAGWGSGYGKRIQIRHSKTVSTMYAHMSRLARRMRPGRKVSQGQIIGYVGSTGRSTGPHLHYEIRVAGKPRNPLTYKVASGTQRLKGRWLAMFRKEKARINRLRRNVPVATRVATIRN